VHGICGNYFYDRDADAEVMMNDPKYLRRHDPRRVSTTRAQGRGRHREGQAEEAPRHRDEGGIWLSSREKAAEVTQAENGIENVAGPGRHAGALGLQRRALGDSCSRRA
jgi:phosphonoacetate hydrolase